MPVLNEWLNENSLRKYPIHEYAPCGIVPDNLIVDTVVLAPDNCSFPLYFSSLFITAGVIVATIKDSTGLVLGIATATINYDSDYFYGVIDPLVDTVSGAITYSQGIQLFIEKNGYGKFDIPRSQGQIESSAIIKTNTNYVKSLGASNNQTLLYNDINIKAGNGIKLEYHPAENGIVISLEQPKEFEPECYNESNCNPNMCGPLAITSLNNVFPDQNGNIIIEGDGVTYPFPGVNMITMGTPNVSTQDLCRNRDVGPPGDPGAPGAAGGSGGGGMVICGVADCCCEYCDSEPIENCQVII